MGSLSTMAEVALKGCPTPLRTTLADVAHIASHYLDMETIYGKIDHHSDLSFHKKC